MTVAAVAVVGRRFFYTGEMMSHIMGMTIIGTFANKRRQASFEMPYLCLSPSAFC